MPSVPGRITGLIVVKNIPCCRQAGIHQSASCLRGRDSIIHMLVSMRFIDMLRFRGFADCDLSAESSFLGVVWLYQHYGSQSNTFCVLRRIFLICLSPLAPYISKQHSSPCSEYTPNMTLSRSGCGRWFQRSCRLFDQIGHADACSYPNIRFANICRMLSIEEYKKSLKCIVSGGEP